MWYCAENKTKSPTLIEQQTKLVISKKQDPKLPPPPRPLLSPFSPEASALINSTYRKKKSLLGDKFGEHLSKAHDWDDPHFLSDARRQRQHLVFTEDDPVPYKVQPYIPTNLATAQLADPNLDLTSYIQPPSNKTSDLLGTALKGAHGADWYDEWRNMLDQHPLPPHEAAIGKKLFGVTGQAASVKQNYGLYHTVNSRLRNGFLKDPQTIYDLKKRGILPSMNKYDPTVHNIYDASAGRDVRTPKIRDYTAPFFGEGGGAIDEWMLRLFTGRSGAPQAKEYDYIQGRLRDLVKHANETQLGGRKDWDINKLQAALWVGYKDTVANNLEHAVQTIKANPTSPANDNTIMGKLQLQIDQARESGAAKDVVSGYDMLDENGKPKDLKKYRAHALLGRHLDKLKELNDAGAQFEFGSKIPIVKGEGLLRQLIEQNPEIAQGRIEIKDDMIWGDKYRIDRLVKEGKLKDHEGNETSLNGQYVRGAPGKNQELPILVQLGQHKSGKGSEAFLAGDHTQKAIDEALQNPEFARDMSEIHQLNLHRKKITNPTLQAALRRAAEYARANPQNAEAQRAYAALRQQTDPFAAFAYDVGRVPEMIAEQAHAKYPMPESFVPNLYHTEQHQPVPTVGHQPFSYNINQHIADWRWRDPKELGDPEEAAEVEASFNPREVRYAAIRAKYRLA